MTRRRVGLLVLGTLTAVFATSFTLSQAPSKRSASAPAPRASLELEFTGICSVVPNTDNVLDSTSILLLLQNASKLQQKQGHDIEPHTAFVRWDKDTLKENRRKGKCFESKQYCELANDEKLDIDWSAVDAQGLTFDRTSIGNVVKAVDLLDGGPEIRADYYQASSVTAPNSAVAARFEITKGKISAALSQSDAHEWDFYPRKITGKPPQCLAQVLTVSLPLKAPIGAEPTIDLKSDRGGVLKFHYPKSSLKILIGNATKKDIEGIGSHMVAKRLDTHFLLHYNVLKQPPEFPPVPVQEGGCPKSLGDGMKILGGDNCPIMIIGRPTSTLR